VIFNYLILNKVEEDSGSIIPRGWTSKTGVKGMRDRGGKEINEQKLKNKRLT